MRGHVRKRGPSWAIVYDEGRDENGKRRQRWRGGFPTKKAAEEELRRVLRSLDTGDYVTPERLTFAEFARERWLPVVESSMRKTTYEAYERTIRLHILPAIGGIQLQKLDAARLDRLYVDLRSKKPKPLSPNTVRFIAAVLSSALDYAERKGLVTRNAAKRSDPPRWQRRQPRTWTTRELGAFLESVKDENDFALWRFLSLSGCRRGEALGLTWFGLDIEARTALMTQQVVPTKDGIEITQPKTASGTRLVTLDDETVRILRDHRHQQIVLKELMAEVYVDHDLVFAKSDGEPLDPRGVSQRFQRLRKAAGLPVIRLHDLRHGVGMEGFRLGIHPEVMRRRLGHANIGITIGTYTTGAAPEVERRAAQSIADAVDRA